MPSKSASKQQPPPLPPEKPAGYQPTLGRKLFMMALCIIGLIIIWTYYFAHGGKL